MTKSKVAFIARANEIAIKEALDGALAEIEAAGKPVLCVNSMLGNNGTVGIIILYEEANEKGCSHEC